MKRFSPIALVTALLLTLVPITGATADYQLDITITKAPVTPDGTTAGAITDFVLTFKDLDPAVEGVTMLEGGTVTATLPDGFIYTGDAGNVAVLLQGWPQSPPAGPPDFLWTTDVVGDAVIATLTSDFVVGDFGPGFKQLHLLLNGFRNPAPGAYRIHLSIQPDPASSDTLEGVGTVIILPRSRPSVSAVSVFSGVDNPPPPPFNNAIYQTVSAGSDANDVGLYLWAGGSSVLDGVINPFLGVDIKMINPSFGRLVQGPRTVGQVFIVGPPGADDFAITTGGPSYLGVAAVTGFDVGVLITTFSTDPDVVGKYVLTFRLNNGNTQQLFVTAE